MSALESRNSKSLAGLTLDAVLSGETQLSPQERHTNRTLLDIIKEDNKEFCHKDKKTWKTFRDKLRLKRTGSAWTSAVHIPASDIAIPKNNHHRKNRRSHYRGSLRSQSVGVIHKTTNRLDLIESVPMSDLPVSSGRPMFTRGSSMRVLLTDDSANATMPSDGPLSRSFKPQMGWHDSIRNHGDGEEEHMRRQPVVTFAEERTLSAREAVAAQEAAEAEAAAAAAASADEEDDENENSSETADKATAAVAPAPPQQPVMSLMDLLEDYDDYDDDDDYDEEEDDSTEDNDGEDGGVGEFNCCICMVKITGAAFIPCGHTFCRMCSRELMVQKGHCPACSCFVLEFLEIF